MWGELVMGRGGESCAIGREAEASGSPEVLVPFCASLHGLWFFLTTMEGFVNSN